MNIRASVCTCMYTNIHDNVRITFFAESAIVFSFPGHGAYRCVLQEGRSHYGGSIDNRHSQPAHLSYSLVHCPVNSFI